MTEGAERLISTLKALGYKTAILSGGFQYFAEYLQAKLGIDEVHANILDVENGRVTGEVKGHIVDGARKAFLLRELAEKWVFPWNRQLLLEMVLMTCLCFQSRA